MRDTTAVECDRIGAELSRVALCEAHPTGLDEFTRMMFARHLRRTTLDADALYTVVTTA